MQPNIQAIILALAAATPLVSAHGKIAVVTGDQGGNGTALGIKGAVVAGSGPNYKTETDTTVFWSKNIATDNDIGFTEGGGGLNKLEDLDDAMAQSGSTLPQVSSDGGSVSGTYHIVTTDGAGPVEALVDEMANAKWSQAKKATVTKQPPGQNGNIKAAKTSGGFFGFRRGLEMVGLVQKRAGNVNEDHVSGDSFLSGIGLYGACFADNDKLDSPSRSRSQLVPPARAPSTVSATFAWSRYQTTTQPAHSVAFSPSRWPAPTRLLGRSGVLLSSTLTFPNFRES